MPHQGVLSCILYVENLEVLAKGLAWARYLRILMHEVLKKLQSGCLTVWGVIVAAAAAGLVVDTVRLVLSFA